MQHRDNLVKAHNHLYASTSEEIAANGNKEGIITQARPYLSVISKNITDKLDGKNIDKYLDEILKDKSTQNINLVKATLTAFKELEKLIDLNPD